MKRALVLILLVGIAWIAAHLQVQRRGTARVVRDGDGLEVLTRPVGWAPRFGVRTCASPVASGQLELRELIQVTTSTGDPLVVDVRLSYQPPRQVPAKWTDTDWCSSLKSHVEDFLRRWSSKSNRDSILSDLRRAGWSASQALDVDLRSAGLRVGSVSARFRAGDEILRARAVPEIQKKSRTQRPVIFVGLDGADWQLLDELMDKGRMPNLASLVRESDSGVLLTQHPPLSPLLWTTMMTGVNPLKHQILDFARFHPVTRNKEPITADERRVPAIWNMATYGGKSVAVFGLWGTYPAEPVHGTIVSDRLITFLFSEEKPPPGVVYPPTREPWAREVLSRSEREVDYAEVKSYLPWLDESEYSRRIDTKDPYSDPVSALRRILVETRVYDGLATDLLRREMPDLTIAYLQGTDSIGHMYAPYTAPRQPHISAEDFQRYHDVPNQYFRWIDQLLGRYRQIADHAGAVLMLASDHGFHWHEGRPTQLSSFAAASAAKWHRREGMYLIYGQGIPVGKNRTGSGNVNQVCATLLALVGLPPGKDVTEPPLTSRTTGGPVDYGAFFTPVQPARGSDAQSADEEIAKLRALGYIGATESTHATTSSGTRTAGSYNNEGLILKDQKKLEQSILAFEKALELDPNLASAQWNLSDILFDKDRNPDRSDELLVRAFANGLPEGTRFLVGRAISYQRSGRADRSLKLLEGAVAAQPSNTEVLMFRGRYRVELKDCAGALDDFHAAQRLMPQNPVPYTSAGLAAICLGDAEEAERSFRKSLALNPNQPELLRYVRSSHRAE